VRRLPVWDLADAGEKLEPSVRADIFRFLLTICGRRLYSLQGREVLNMLLSLEEWTDGEVLDETAVEKVLDTSEQRPQDQKEPCLPRQPSPPQHGTQRPTSPLSVQPNLVRRSSSLDSRKREPKDTVQARPSKRGQGLRARVEAALEKGACLGNGAELVGLYKKSGLTGGAKFEGRAVDDGRGALELLMCIAAQRYRDLFIDPLQEASGQARVHFPHLYIDLQKRQTKLIPTDAQRVIEQKIKAGDRWTCMEKAHVLRAPHEITVRYILAYALARAKKTKRDQAIWIPLGMNTGAQGHANAVCLQPLDGQGTMKVLIYDPNFHSDREHWVHSKKAIADALPEVQQLLAGSDVRVNRQPELFGHGLQTALGTTSRHEGWFSRTVTTTHRGYPICGAVVHLLAAVWLSVAADSSGAALDSVVDVESALAEIVSTPAGKKTIQCKVGAILEDLTKRLWKDGPNSFRPAMRCKLDADRRDWPKDMVRHGGSVSIRVPGCADYSYEW